MCKHAAPDTAVLCQAMLQAHGSHKASWADTTAPELHERKRGRAHRRLHVDGQHLAILRAKESIAAGEPR